MTFMLTGGPPSPDQYDTLAAIADSIDACVDRIEEVIGLGNFKWVLMTLLLLLAIWYIWRRR